MGWCSSCGKVVVTERDEVNGFTCCTLCGRVLDDNVYSSDPTFTKTAGGQSQAEGNFIRDGQNSSFARMGGRTFGAQSDSHERTLAKGKVEIVEIVERLHIRPKDDVVSAAHRLYTIAVERNFTRGRRTNQVAAACLYIECRQENKPYMLIDFSDCLQTNVYVLGAVFLQLCRLLRLEQHPLMQKPVDPSLFIHRFADRLQFGKKMHTVANTALRLVASMKRDWMQTGRRPSGICGAALFISSHIHGFEHTKSDVVSVVHICEATLKKRLTEFETTESGQLTAEEFESKAKEIEQHMRNIDFSVPSYDKGKGSEILCEHKDSGVHFAHGLCRACYEEFLRVSGGMQGGSAPPAFQRAEKRRKIDEAEKSKLLNATDEDRLPSTSGRGEDASAGVRARGKRGGRGRGLGRGFTNGIRPDDIAKMPNDLEASSTVGQNLGAPVVGEEVYVGIHPTGAAEGRGISKGITTNATVAPKQQVSSPQNGDATKGECKPGIPHDYEGLQQDEAEADTLSDIDDDEVRGYLFNEDEVKLKTEIWTHMNKDYLEAQAAKLAALARTEAAQAAAFAAAMSNDASAAELAAAVAEAVAKQKRERKQKRAEDASKKVPAETAAEATRQMLASKKLSSKVNYNVLAKLFGEETRQDAVDGNKIEHDEKSPRDEKACKDADVENGIKRRIVCEGKIDVSEMNLRTVDDAVAADGEQDENAEDEDIEEQDEEGMDGNDAKFRLEYGKNEEFDYDDEY